MNLRRTAPAGARATAGPLRAVAALFALQALVAAQGVGAGAPPLPPALLARLADVRGAAPATPAQLLEAAGDAATLFDALVRAHTTASADAARLGTAERRALRAALVSTPVEALELAGEHATHGQAASLASIDVLADVAPGSDLAAFFDAVDTLSCDGAERAVWRVVTEAAGRLLARLPESADDFARGLSGLTPSTRSELVAALVGAPADPALTIATVTLAHDPDVEVAALALIFAVAPAATPERRDAAAPLVRERLLADDPVRLAVAIRATGALRDDEATALLIGLLAHDLQAIRHCAHRALVAVTGRSFPLDPRPWRLWYDAEEAWWSEATKLPGVLELGDVAAATAALRELSTRTTRTRTRAELAATALRHEAPAVRALAATLVGRLGGEAATEELVQLADDDPSIDVRRAARRALTALQGGPSTRPSSDGGPARD